MDMYGYVWLIMDIWHCVTVKRSFDAINLISRYKWLKLCAAFRSPLCATMRGLHFRWGALLKYVEMIHHDYDEYHDGWSRFRYFRWQHRQHPQLINCILSRLKLPQDFSDATPANKHGLWIFSLECGPATVSCWMRKWLASGTTIHLAQHLLKI